MLEFLGWIGSKPRTYRDAMDAWKSSCPRHPVFEDALAGGLIEIGDAEHIDDRPVSLTSSGTVLLSGQTMAR